MVLLEEESSGSLLLVVEITLCPDYRVTQISINQDKWKFKILVRAIY